MPPLPTIAHTYRVTLTSTSSTKPPVHNTFHILDFTDPDPSIIAGYVQTALVNANVDNLIQGLPTDYSVTQIAALPLDGVTAAHVQATTGSVPAGLQSGDIIPEASVVITLYSAHRGPSGRGRVYIGPLTESVVTNGVPLASMVATMTTAWQNLRSNILAAATSPIVVVASYANSVAHEVTSIAGKPYQGTQRRRLTRLR